MGRMWQFIRNQWLLIWQLIKDKWYLVFFFAYVTFSGIVLFALLRADPKLATATVAFGTLVLAIVTVISIENSRAIARKRREEELEKEKRDRQEKLLNEIIEWAENVINCGFGSLTITATAVGGESKELLALQGNKLLAYQSIDLRSKYITKTTEVFGKDLRTAVLEVISHLDKVRNALVKRIKKFEDKESTETLAKYEHELRKSAINLIELTTDIKIRCLGVSGKD